MRLFSCSSDRRLIEWLHRFSNVDDYIFKKGRKENKKITRITFYPTKLRFHRTWWNTKYRTTGWGGAVYRWIRNRQSRAKRERSAVPTAVLIVHSQYFRSISQLILLADVSNDQKRRAKLFISDASFSLRHFWFHLNGLLRTYQCTADNL